MAEALRARAVAEGRCGVIISFPSGVAPPSEYLAVMSAVGIQVLVPFGTKEECLGAFLKREREEGTNRDAEYWNTNNLQQHAHFSSSSFAAYRIAAFEGGRFRSRAALISEVRSRIFRRQDSRTEAAPRLA